MIKIQKIEMFEFQGFIADIHIKSQRGHFVYFFNKICHKIHWINTGSYWDFSILNLDFTDIQLEIHSKNLYKKNEKIKNLIIYIYFFFVAQNTHLIYVLEN